ncbi:MAG: hypothetical protein LIO92_01600, partial [Clostridiales bacterium]|nr:hypothetical protein [Clostridiales bacterium]
NFHYYLCRRLGGGMEIIMSQKQKKTIIIDVVRYHADRPSSCKDCYFWKNNRKGCVPGKNNCYYLAETPKKTECDGCPYAKGRLKAIIRLS